jgi:predicted nucleotidyltransferase component of viral defense system
MIIKGGILLAIRYKSQRFTRDIDFSTPQKLNEIRPEEVEEQLNQSLAITVNELDYGLDCKVQSCKVRPKDSPEASFPCIELKIGYAYKGDAKHKRLMAGLCPTTISIDYSLNEETPNVEDLSIGDGNSIPAYSFTDIIAEKFRSILQQVERNRFRRQDIFDLYFLITSEEELTGNEKYEILVSLMKKSRSRGIEPTVSSLDDKEIYERSKAEYHTLKDEVEGELPEFDEIYAFVKDFYKSLDWPN